jgi:hypothetical protein
MADSEDKQPNQLASLLRGEKPWSGAWKYNPGLYQHMHALGVIAANYNHLESLLGLLIAVFMGDVGETVGPFLFQKLSNSTRLDLLKQLYAAQITDTNFLDRLDWFVAGYGKCAENRNILMHSTPDNSVTSSKIASVLELKKASKNNPGAQNFISLELGQLHRIADDIDRFDDYGFQLIVFESARRQGGKINLLGKEILPALPDKPLAPILLTLLSQKFPTDDQPPPQP